MNENFTDEEKRLLALSDDDHRNIISAYVEGQEFSREFILSLNLPDSKRECLDYNDNVKRFRFYQEQIKSFTSYLETVKGWFK